MKRNYKILISLLIILFPCILSAQTHYKGNFYLGGKAGADFSQVFFNPTVKQSFQPGITAGLMFRYIEESHFGIIAEFNFIQRGWKENFEKANQFRYSRTLNYFELPIMAHIYFGSRGKFFFNAGPEIAYMFRETTSSNFNYPDVSGLEGFPTSNRTNVQMGMPVKNKIDYGICAALGGEFNINRKNSITAEVRFYYGLGNIFSAKRTDIFNASNQMTISATIGYWFRIK